MFHEIRNRLLALEHSKKHSNVPVLVFVFWDEAKQQWYAKEQYVKTNSKGKIIPRTGRIKLIPLNSPDEYRPPEGFKGTIIHGRVLE